jgi:hypothetical protein
MLITSKNSPSVKMINGSVINVSTGLITVFAIPSTPAPMMYAHQPWIRTPEKSASATQRAAALIAQAITRRSTSGTSRGAYRERTRRW